MHPESEKQAPAWAIVEIMGHRVIAGRISEVSRFGASFCRVEVDLPDGTIAAQEYSGSAIFCITPSDEATVRRRQASGTYAGPLAIDPPRSEALALMPGDTVRKVVFHAGDYMADDDKPDDVEDFHCNTCSRTTNYPDDEKWTRVHVDGVPAVLCYDCSEHELDEPVSCERAACPDRTRDPDREEWQRGEHDGISIWLCAKHGRPVDPNAPTCSECGEPLSPGGDCENFPTCPKSPLPF